MAPVALVSKLPGACVTLPLPATRSMLPVLAVRMSAPAAKLALCPASTLMLPVPLVMSALALTVMSPAASSVWSSTLPLPLALMAVPSVPADPVPLPSLSTIEPVLLLSTMAPLPALVIRSDCRASVTLELVTLPSVLTRLTVTVTSPTVTPSLSSR